MNATERQAKKNREHGIIKGLTTVYGMTPEMYKWIIEKFDEKTAGDDHEYTYPEIYGFVNSLYGQIKSAQAAAKASYKATAEQAESLKKEKEYRAGHDAGRAGSVAASIATAKQAEQLRKKNEAMKAASGGTSSPDPAKDAAIIEQAAPSDVQEVRQEAMNEQANAYKQENEMYLPNTDVKSDYTKWLIFGALGLAALYILKGD